MINNRHIPVMSHEVMQGLEVKPGHWYIDGTFGRGGHTELLLNAGASVIAFDFDHEAIQFGSDYFSSYIKQNKLILKHTNFTEIGAEIQKVKTSLNGDIKIFGVLFDFGTSSHQLLSSKRGFSFQENGPLDMRMDTRLSVTAADLLAVVPEKQLAELFSKEGGELHAKRIAKEIKRHSPVTETHQLVSIITRVKKKHAGRLHPATQVFQALRIAVNSEIVHIEQALPIALDVLESFGRIVTIAFHEGEDSVVKRTFTHWEEKKLGKKINKKPLMPTQQEKEENPRSRSAKVRVFEKI